MLNEVKNAEDILNSQIGKKSEVSKLHTNPIKNAYMSIDKGFLIDETAISNEAVSMYEKEQDIRTFTKLAMSDPNDFSHDAIISKLFAGGVEDPLSDEAMEKLSSNERLLKDLFS
ncbi:MAG TPA: hypothetical protein PLG15_06695 [Candidatus Gastranaerophilaceae bacterium]|nr:hypothetical protein [Candidatus Gastranaerophilaceae bacterium]HPT42055.1 hypothetical protein [Candidatus Gastranaerophilaceae bacterium]